MNNNEILNMFIATLNSDGSRLLYKDIITKFLNSTGKDVVDINALDYSSYVINNYNNIKVSTRNMRVNILKSFSRWLYENDFANKNYGANIKPLRGESEPHDRLTRNEAYLMLDKGNSREKAIISLLLNTGLRISEIINIEIKDYNNDELKIKTKGSRYRTIYLNDDTKRYINMYLKTRKDNTNYLFTSNTGTKLKAQCINASWSKLANKANIDKHITSHSFRRLVVTEVANDYGIAVAQKFIGHKSIATTARYFQEDEELIKSIYLKNTHEI